VKNQRAVENRMREVLETDRARVQVGRISRFGLMEMSRQRLRPSLEEITTELCPRCSGQGRIRDVRSLALGILRVMEEEALKERSSIVRAIVPLSVGSYLLNEKRRDVAEIERRTNTHLVIVPTDRLETPHYEVQRIRDDLAEAEAGVASYELADAPLADEIDPRQPEPVRSARPQEAVIRPTAPPPPLPQPLAIAPAPAPQPSVAQVQPQSGLLSRIFGSIFKKEAPAEISAPRPPAPVDTSSRGGRNEARGDAQRSDESRSGGPRSADRSRRGRGGRSRSGPRSGERAERSQELVTVGGEGGAPRNGARGRRGSRDGDEAASERPAADRAERPNRDRGRRGRDDNAERRPRPPREDADVAVETEAGEVAHEPSREPRRDRSPNDSARAEARTRDVNEDRTPADLEQSKRRPRRDRASVARNQGDEQRRPQPSAEPVEEASPIAANTMEPAELVDLAARVQVVEAPAFETAEPVREFDSAPIDDAPRPKPVPSIVVVSPIEAAAEAVKQEPERPAGRAANDPREVRKREREARLRQEGVIGERSPE
jgi:ribonuclease E